MSDFENISDNSPAGADGAAQKALEMFEKGASIEEVNKKLFGTDNGPLASAPDDSSDKRADGVAYENDEKSSVLEGNSEEKKEILRFAQNDNGNDKVNYSGNDNHFQNGADSAYNRTAENEENVNGAASNNEKVISQNELDLLVGRRLAKERRAHDRVKADLDSALDGISKLLGVSKEEALSALKKANYRHEAEENNISDVEMYERLKIAEEKNAAYENAEKERKEALDINEFKNTITLQIEKLAINDAELSKASEDNYFNSLVRYFYDNPLTRDDCVGMAYNAFVKKNGVITPSQNPSTADAVPLPLGKGGNNAGNDLNGNTQAQAPSIPKPKRAHENASSSGAAAPDSRMDVESMSLKDFDKIYEKVKRGETVMP